ncbi:aldehyde ferredoxin oxidoreductase C-terminal domain-containing protein, partial [Halobacterium bonnevillei]
LDEQIATSETTLTTLDPGEEATTSLDVIIKGADMSQSIIDAIERVWNLVRLYNLREGHERVDDALPDAMTEPLPDGPAAGAALDPGRFEAMLDDYYEARGWTGEGVPVDETLARLDLQEVAP